MTLANEVGKPYVARWFEAWDYRLQPMGWVANVYCDDGMVRAYDLVEPVDADIASAPVPCKL